MGLTQQASGDIADGGTLAFGVDVSAGSLLTAHMRFADNTTLVNGIIDTRGNLWIQADRQAAAGAGSAELWYCANPNAGPNTLTFDWSATLLSQVCIAEFSAFSSGVSLDVKNKNTATGDPFSHGNITTTQATGVSVTSGVNVGAFSVSAVGDSFTVLTNGTRSTRYYKVTSATGTWDCDLDFAASEEHAGVIAHFYSGAAAAAVVRRIIARPFPFTPGGTRFQ